MSSDQVKTEKRARAAGSSREFHKHGINKRKPDNSVSFPDWVSGSLMLMRKEAF